MPVIMFASAKGGVGKSTTTLNLAHAYAHLAGPKQSIAIIDADENGYCIDWAQSFPEQVPENLKVIVELDHRRLPEALRAAAQEHNLVLVDFEGTANAAFVSVVELADLIIVPLKPNRPDLKAAMRVVHLVREQIDQLGLDIKIRLLFTQTKQAIIPRSQKQFHETILKANIPLFKTQMRDLNAFTHSTNFGYRLDNLPKSLEAGAKSARANIEALLKEAALVLKGIEPDEEDERELRKLTGVGLEDETDDDQDASAETEV